MNILVLGGRRFVGKKLVQNLIEEGNNVTVANRSGRPEFGSDACYIVFDRNSRGSIRENIGRRNYDVIYDMICYSPQNAIDMIENISAGKYIMVSSSVVYDWGMDHKETDFDAKKYCPMDGTIEELRNKFGFKQAYKLGKMSSEAIITQNERGIHSTCVRFPLIIGVGDHTGRMETYIDAVRSGKGIWVDNIYSEVSMVEAGNAAEYLSQIKDKDVQGAINLCDKGSVTIMKLVKMISDILGMNIIWKADGVGGGYNGYYSNTFAIDKMFEAGIAPRNLDIEAVIRNLLL